MCWSWVRISVEDAFLKVAWFRKRIMCSVCVKYESKDKNKWMRKVKKRDWDMDFIVVWENPTPLFSSHNGGFHYVYVLYKYKWKRSLLQTLLLVSHW